MNSSAHSYLHTPNNTLEQAEHKDTEELLRRSEKRFRALIENSADAIALMNAQGTFLYASPSTTRVLGYLPEELVGRNAFGELAHPDDLDSTRRIFAGLLQEPGKSMTAEFRLRHKDGYWRWIEGSGLNLLEDPHVAAIVANYRDITDRKRLEGELKRSRDQLEVILQNVRDGIIVQDATGKIIYANLAGAMAAGYTSVEEMLAAPLLAYLERFEIYDEQGNPFPPSYFPGRRAIEGEVNPQAKIRYIDKQTREVRWAFIGSSAVVEAGRTPFLVVSVLQDITQFKELEQRKDEFIMHVSHELRTPLTALNGFLELLREHHTELDFQSKELFFYRALENCQELTHLVNTVLDTLRLTHKSNTAQPEKLSLALVVQKVLEQLDPRTVKEYTLQVDIPEQVAVWADEEYLRLVLGNLIMNAFKYAPKHTSVEISAVPGEYPGQGTAAIPQVCISVQDRGPGIPPAEQPLLFEKFTRLKRDLASTVRGTGLGLYISKQLVERMRGHIWVESTGQAGEGSCFCFTLPIALPDSRTEAHYIFPFLSHPPYENEPAG